MWLPKSVTTLIQARQAPSPISTAVLPWLLPWPYFAQISILSILCDLQISILSILWDLRKVGPRKQSRKHRCAKWWRCLSCLYHRIDQRSYQYLSIWRHNVHGGRAMSSDIMSYCNLAFTTLIHVCACHRWMTKKDARPPRPPHSPFKSLGLTLTRNWGCWKHRHSSRTMQSSQGRPTSQRTFRVQLDGPRALVVLLLLASVAEVRSYMPCSSASSDCYYDGCAVSYHKSDYP